MSNTQYDAIVIGAGHNGLVAANYLAKAGKKVLVLERRAVAGGQLVTESFSDGLTADTLHASATLRPDIVRDLGLHGAAFEPRARLPYVAMLADGARLVLDADTNKAADAIRKFSTKDAERWPEFIAFMQRATDFLDAAYRTRMSRLPNFAPIAEGMPLAALLLKLRRLGGRDMFRVVRAMSMSAEELTGNWFESEAVRSAVCALAIHGVTLGPMSAGTGYTLMHNWLNRGGLGHAPVAGGVGQITDALVAALKSRGGELRTSAGVKNIHVEQQRTKGVQLESGENISARQVLSATDPRHTLLGLVGATELPPEFVWQARSIKLRGCVAKVHALTNGKHALPDGTVAVAPSIRYLERAYDAAKYGEISKEPYIEATANGNVVSMHVQFAPYTLRNSDWAHARAGLESLAIETLDRHCPGFKLSIQQTKTLTPADMERDYGLSEGDLNHGQLILDQIFFMRPLPGWSNHKTPVDGLYLCGNGVHGGGGISGASGRNAAKIASKEK